MLLKKILYEFENSKIEILLTDGYSIPNKVTLKKTLKERLEKEEI